MDIDEVIRRRRHQEALGLREPYVRIADMLRPAVYLTIFLSAAILAAPIVLIPLILWTIP